MKNNFAINLVVVGAMLLGATATIHAKAQSEAPALSAVSALPLASVFPWLQRAGLSGAPVTLHQP